MINKLLIQLTAFKSLNLWNIKLTDEQRIWIYILTETRRDNNK